MRGLRAFRSRGRYLAVTLGEARMRSRSNGVAPHLVSIMLTADRMESQTKTIRRRSRRRPRARTRLLKVVYSPDASALGRTFALTGERWTLGRAVEGPGHLADDALSRMHVRFTPRPGAVYVVEDLRTSNGSFLDGRSLTEVTPLEVGQVLSVGETLLVVDAEPPRDALPTRDDATGDVPEIRGTSLTSERLRLSIATVAPTAGSVLILGPTGSGKEVAARALERLSGRRGAFVPVNCAAIPSSMAEAELFGYAKGAFTGATSEHEGFFAQADGGTIFLDEVGDLPEPVQAKLLRVLETGEVQRLGEERRRILDLRVVAATHKNLDNLDFRKDLFARLGDWVLRIPSLAERRADILDLFDFFLETEEPRPYSSEFAEALLLYDWPMNVRELQKMARRLANLRTGNRVLDVEDLPELLQGMLDHRFEEAEEIEDEEVNAPPREELEALLAATEGNVKQAAIEYGCHRNQLYRWLRRRRIDPRVFRAHV